MGVAPTCAVCCAKTSGTEESVTVERRADKEETSMFIGGGVKMLRSQYLVGYKTASIELYPTVPRPNVQVECKIDGTIDDVFEKHPELEEALYNDVKVCSCGKPCAFTMTICNSCGKELPDTITKSENVFMAFLFGVKSAKKGFPYKISLRRETEDFLIFDDMLQLTPCHLNGIPKNYYIPDWRFLLKCPQQSLELLDSLEEELWFATQPFLENAAYRKLIFREGVSNDDIRKNVISSFNFPPSQFQLHVQWLVPPLVPFQHYMAEIRNHFHEGRGFPLTYVRKILALNKPYDVVKDTPIEMIMEYYKGLGIDYKVEWTEWYEKVCLASTLSFQNWNADDFSHVVQDNIIYNFIAEDGQVKLCERADGVDLKGLQEADKKILQNYGRPYGVGGKPSGTYIQNPIEPKFGTGGLLRWPPTEVWG